MKRKIVIIVVLAALLMGSISASGLALQKNEKQSLGDPTPKIYYIAVCTSGKRVDSGYTNIYYRARSRNEIGGSVDIVFDWGDGTTSTVTDVEDWVIEPHIYTKSGTFNIRVRYGGYSSWSDPVEFPIIDHCDLELIDVFTVPENFGKRDKIDIKATVRNEGTISTTQDTTLKLYEGYHKFVEDDPIKQISTGIIAPGQEVTITLKDFRWYGDEVTHSFWARVEPVPGEIDFTTLDDHIDDPNINNYCDGHFTAHKIKSLDILCRSIILNLLYFV
jgi:hypothetical protein